MSRRRRLVLLPVYTPWSPECRDRCCQWCSCTLRTPFSWFHVLNYTILYYTIVYYTILYYTILYYTIRYYTILYYTILYYTILYYTILYYTILYYTIQSCTALYYIIYPQILCRPLTFALTGAPDMPGHVHTLQNPSSPKPKALNPVPPDASTQSLRNLLSHLTLQVYLKS